MYAEHNAIQQTNGENTRYSMRTQVRCANCDIDILWPAIVIQGKTYCCTGCAQGGPCSCDYSQYRSVKIAGVIHYGIERPDEYHP